MNVECALVAKIDDALANGSETAEETAAFAVADVTDDEVFDEAFIAALLVDGDDKTVGITDIDEDIVIFGTARASKEGRDDIAASPYNATMANREQEVEETRDIARASSIQSFSKQINGKASSNSRVQPSC